MSEQTLSLPDISNRKEFFEVENFETVYNRVEQTWQDPEKAAYWHRFLGRVLKPQVHFADGVEDRIGQALDNGSLVALALTHGSMLDPPHIAAMAENNEVFEPMKGKTMIGAKVSLFAAPMIGKIVPNLGAVPVWRRKDVLTGRESAEEKERLETTRKAAGRAFIRTLIAGMNTDHHMAMHVEGTRNRDDPQKIQKVQGGFGEIVCGIDPDVDVLMVTASFYYGASRLSKIWNWRKPVMYLDIPEDQSRDDPKAVTRNITPALQHSLDQAVLLHK